MTIQLFLINYTKPKFSVMKKQFLIIFSAGWILFTACGGGDKVVVKDGEISAADLPKVADKMSEGVKESQDRWAARKAKGDTLAMPYKDLQSYLPEVSGYTRDGGPKGSQMNMPGMGGWSEAEQRYVNGDKNVDVKIIDYNASQMGFAGVTAIYKMGFSSEDDTKKEGSVDLGMKDVAAFETTYKTEQRSKLVLIVADRFYIDLENDGTNDPEVLRSVAKSMKLSELASK